MLLAAIMVFRMCMQRVKWADVALSALVQTAVAAAAVVCRCCCLLLLCAAAFAAAALLLLLLLPAVTASAAAAVAAAVGAALHEAHQLTARPLAARLDLSNVPQVVHHQQCATLQH